MNVSTQGALKPAGLSRREKAAYGILVPLLVALVGFWAVLSTATGEGPSIGGRGMVLALVLFPVAFVASGLLNVWVLFVPLNRRMAAFVLGAVVPGLLLVCAYLYLWRLWPFAA